MKPYFLSRIGIIRRLRNSSGKRSICLCIATLGGQINRSVRHSRTIRLVCPKQRSENRHIDLFPDEFRKRLIGIIVFRSRFGLLNTLSYTAYSTVLTVTSKSVICTTSPFEYCAETMIVFFSSASREPSISNFEPFTVTASLSTM